MAPLVSILVPCYNAEPWLAETLQSVLAQTWPRKEIVVVDDGSRDNSAALARSFSGPNVLVQTQPNRGAAAARNRAFAACSGDFIQYLDADDLLAPDKIETQVRRLEQEGTDCLASCRWGRFHTRVEETWFVPEPFWTDLPPVDWLVSCLGRISMMHPGAWLVPRSIALKAGPWNETLSLNDDGEFFCRGVLASRKVCFCPDAVSYYRSGLPGSLSRLRSDSAWLSYLRCVELWTHHLLQKEDSQRTRQVCARSIQSFIYEAYPDVPELVRRAEDKVRVLGGGDLPFLAGRKMQLLSRLVGWRLAKRLQRLLRVRQAAAK